MTSGGRTLHRQSRVLARFKSENQIGPEQGPNQGTDESTRVERRLGFLRFVNRVPGVGVVQESSVVPLPPTGVTNLEYELLPLSGTTRPVQLTWTPDPTATSYETLVEYTGATASEIMNNSVTINLPNWAGTPPVQAGIRSVNATGSVNRYVSITL